MTKQYEIHWENEVDDSIIARAETLAEAISRCNQETVGMEEAIGRTEYDKVKQERYYVLDLATFTEENGADEVYSTAWYWSNDR